MAPRQLGSTTTHGPHTCPSAALQGRSGGATGEQGARGAPFPGRARALRGGEPAPLPHLLTRSRPRSRHESTMGAASMRVRAVLILGDPLLRRCPIAVPPASLAWNRALAGAGEPGGVAVHRGRTGNAGRVVSRSIAAPAPGPRSAAHGTPHSGGRARVDGHAPRTAPLLVPEPAAPRAGGEPRAAAGTFGPVVTARRPRVCRVDRLDTHVRRDS